MKNKEERRLTCKELEEELTMDEKIKQAFTKAGLKTTIGGKTGSCIYFMNNTTKNTTK